MSGAAGGSAVVEPAVWQDLEFGSHLADLPLWEELATAGTPVLELGGGAGRVAMHLASAGRAVIAVEREARLAAELERRASSLPVSVVCADLAELDRVALPAAPGSAIAPLHVVQQLEPPSRRELLAALARLLPTGARFGATLVDEASLLEGELRPRSTPDMRDLDGWVFSSEPLWAQVDAEEIKARRLRQRVSPDGEIERTVHDDVLRRLSPEALEREAADAGFRSLERRRLRSGSAEADSIAVILEAR